MPILGGPPTVFRPPDPKESEGAAWWVYALVACFLLAGVALAVAMLAGVV